jgi:hypothetical protein
VTLALGEAMTLNGHSAEKNGCILFILFIFLLPIISESAEKTVAFYLKKFLTPNFPNQLKKVAFLR